MSRTPARSNWRVTATLCDALPSTACEVVFDGNEIRGLEQNSETKSRWAQIARSAKNVMQFLSESRYVANVVDGKVTLYGRRGDESLRRPYDAS